MRRRSGLSFRRLRRSREDGGEHLAERAREGAGLLGDHDGHRAVDGSRNGAVVGQLVRDLRVECELDVRAWTLAEPSTTLPPGYTPETTILVARSVDAGWLPTFTRVAGVVIETGGDLSHGSILLREIGLPAITNVGRATRLLATGAALVLRAGEGVVERVE